MSGNVLVPALFSELSDPFEKRGGNMGAFPSEGSWVAVHVQSNMEKSVAFSLGQRGYESFLPTYKVLRTLANRRAELELPLFRGYVFCRWMTNNRQTIVRVPRVIRIVGFGKTPAPIDEAEMAALRRIADSRVISMPWRYLRVGERVRIAGGALSGLEGILVRTASAQYIVVNLTLMGRGVAAKVHASQLVPCELFETGLVRENCVQ